MTKTKCFKNVTAVLMAVIMMFATLGITAFAKGSIDDMTASGSVGDLTVKITYSDCDGAGVRSSKEITFNKDTTVPCYFSSSGPKAIIEFYRNDAAVASYTISKPAYISGMPAELSTYIYFAAGTYTFSVRSDDASQKVSGYVKLSHVSGTNG